MGECSVFRFRCRGVVPHCKQKPVMKKPEFSRLPVKPLLVSFIMGMFSVTVGQFSFTKTITSEKGSSVPALFVFGDSLADPGNNNHLMSLAKANHPPYGRQFDTHTATGRFTNGRTTMDFLAAELGLPLTPPFMDPATKGSRILQGVNYASAGSGILNSTGMYFVSVEESPESSSRCGSSSNTFKIRRSPKLLKNWARRKSKELFSKAIYYIITGSNDFLNGYYFLIPTSPRGITINDFVQLLVNTASQQLKALYALGARKIGVAGLAPLGCCPSQITKYNLTSGDCVGFLNDVSKQYNSALKKALTELRVELKDIHLVYSNLYDPILDAINNPAKYGFNFTHTACCGVGKLNGKFLCMAFSRPCGGPERHIFFNYYHPTDTMYNLFFKSVYFNGPSFSEPYSGQYLASI